MKKEWLLLFTLLPGLFATSCTDEVFEGYKGDQNMTQQLPVDWAQAANKSAGILTTSFLPAGNSLFGKELRWDSTQDNPTEIFVDFATGEDVKLTSQMEGVKVLLRNYLRSGDNNTLTVAQNILNAIEAQLDTNNYDEVAQFSEIMLLLYEATGDESIWTELKSTFAAIEAVTEVTDPQPTTGEGGEEEGGETTASGYTNGTNGVPASATDARRTAKGQGLAVMLTAKMAEIAADKGEADAEKYKAQDEEVRKRVEAKNALEGYCFGVRNSLSNEQFANAVSQADKDTINKEINDTLAWIDSHQDADVATFEAKQKELEAKLMPIMQNAYQHAAPGGAGGMPGGIDPNMFNQGGAPPPGGGHSGPRVEEVD